MRDHRRGLESEPADVPFGINVVADGRKTHLAYSALTEGPLRKQMRDAALGLMLDRGGRVRSVLTAREVANSARYVEKALLAHASVDERPLDIRTLTVETLHAALFEGRQSPASVRTTYARRLLLDAAATAGATCQPYLQNLRLHGFAQPSEPYTEEELACVIEWCRTRLNAMFMRRKNALAEIGGLPSDDDEALLRRADTVLEAHPEGSTREYRWWVAKTYVHGAALTERGDPERSLSDRAVKALFPNTLDAMAAALLVINEYGAEGSVLVSMEIGDVRRDANDSSVMVIRGIKTRADKAVSRRGNAVSTWSGGKVLERWIEVTAPARRWTGTEHVWLWQQNTSRDSAKVVRAPFATFVPARPIILEGGAAVIEGPLGGDLRLSTRRMRKTWHVRADRAFGAGFAGALDPNHDQRTAWTFYRSVALTKEERLTVLAEAQDDYLATITAAGVVVGDQMTRPEAMAALTDRGVPAAAAERILRGAGTDSGTAQCRNPEAAPGQAEGTLCKKTPFACLLCPNAVHTVAHLPVVLALRDHLQDQRQTLPAEDFVARWAGVDLGVERIVESFSGPAIAAAEADVAAATQRIAQLGEAYR